jgi:transposase
MRKTVIGIDISKLTIDATILYFGKTENYHKSFLNKKFGFKKVLEWIATKSNDKNQLFCIEDTGFYGRDLCLFLEKEDQEYAIINPVEIKKSVGLVREKSDKNDSKIIATYGLKFPERLRSQKVVKSELLGLQLLLTQRNLLQNKELDFQRSLKQLKHCLSSDKVAKMIVKENAKTRKFLQQKRKATEQQLEEYIASIPALKKNYDLLQSITGIGPIISMQVIIQSRNFEGIKEARKFSCYCGVVPFKNESGTSVRKGTRISYYGHKGLKRLINFGALNAVKYDPQIKAYYQRKLESGKNKMSVINAVRNKLIHRMYAVVKRGTPYVVQPTF